MTAYDKMKYIIEHGNYGDEVRKLPETVWYQGCVRKFDVLAEREFPRWETDDEGYAHWLDAQIHFIYDPLKIKPADWSHMPY